MDLLIDANTLKSSNIQKRSIDENINDIIKNINVELKSARSNGQNGIITELPIVFQIPNMNNKDAQRIIWSTIIDVLKKKNYNVIINHNSSNCRLKITILNKEDDVKIKQQMDILASSTGIF